MKYSENLTFHTGYEDIQVKVSSIEFFRILKRLKGPQKQQSLFCTHLVCQVSYLKIPVTLTGNVM